GRLELLSPKNLHYGSNFARMILENGTDQTQTDYMATTQAIALLESRAYPVAEGARNLVKLKPDAPFFIGVGLVRPHVPFIAPERCFIPYPDSLMEVPPTSVDSAVPEAALFRQNEKIWGMNDQQKQKTIAAYLASVQYMDEQVGRLLDALDRLDLRKNTIIVFVSDHGYNLGEHNSWSKISLWEESVQVPLIVSVPGADASKGQSCNTVTELIDLYPTLTDLCDLSDKNPEMLQGKNLTSFIKTGKPIEGEYYAYSITKQGKGASIRSSRWRYNRWGDKAIISQEELYDHLNDPKENYNLARLPAHEATLQKMRQKLDAFQKRAKTALD
ncbi:MAG: sulfatase-like hydrolase/transferase, partial [Bacteroidota bacterium]